MTPTIQHHRRLTAPPHLRGPMVGAPLKLRRERRAWITRVSRDYAAHEIASALGLSRSAVATILNRARRPEPKAFETLGIRFGRLPSAVAGMSDKARDRLQRYCARTGEPVAVVLARHWSEADQ